MSRCFAYPPPGYTPSRASEDALIESIKLQKEKEKTKDKELRKKDKKREKDEKRKEKKDKARRNMEKSNSVDGDISGKFCADAKAKENELKKMEKRRKKEEKRKLKKERKHKNSEKSSIDQGLIGEPFRPDKAQFLLLHKRNEAETEQLEQSSSLTEEHGQPVYLCEPSTSSDSTENNNKRKKECSSTDVVPGYGNGKISRLSSNKIGPNDIVDRHKRENFCNKSGRNQKYSQIDLTDASRRSGIPPKSNPVMSSMERVQSQYMNLISNLVPPLQNPTLDNNLDDWLLKSGDVQSERRQICGNDSMSCSSSSVLWPCPQYLQDVDLYAMPFTVPF